MCTALRTTLSHANEDKHVWKDCYLRRTISYCMGLTERVAYAYSKALLSKKTSCDVTNSAFFGPRVFELKAFSQTSWHSAYGHAGAVQLDQYSQDIRDSGTRVSYLSPVSEVGHFYVHLANPLVLGVCVRITIWKVGNGSEPACLFLLSGKV